jgi:hypothetical protein
MCWATRLRYCYLLQLFSYKLVLATSEASTTQAPSYKFPRYSIDQITGRKISSFFSQCLDSIQENYRSRPESRSFRSGRHTRLKDLQATVLYESIGGLGPGSVYHGCDGIPRFKRTGAVTALQTTKLSPLFAITKTFSYLIVPFPLHHIQHQLYQSQQRYAIGT